MNKQALAKIAILIPLSLAGCSLVVNADRSKVKDNLYRATPVDSMPTEPEPDAGDDAAAPSVGAAGDAGAGGASDAGGTAGSVENAGAGGV